MTGKMKKDHLYSEQEKLNWFGDGEWLKEPDKVDFTYRDYECIVLRTCMKEPYAEKFHMFGGFLCGCVKIPNNHVFYCKPYDDISVDCHYGLTFGKKDSQENYWIGFDCAHSGDYTPSTEKLKKEDDYLSRLFPIPKEFKEYALFNPIYRNIDYCINECKSIVDQLIEAK
jgi:hypothetical protein